MSKELPKPLKCSRCGIYPEVNDDNNNYDPLSMDRVWRIFCIKCGTATRGFSHENAIEKWNRAQSKTPTKPNSDEIVVKAVRDIESILRAAEGRYTFICRFCAHYKTKDCCDRDGKCTPEWRGIKEEE